MHSEKSHILLLSHTHSAPRKHEPILPESNVSEKFRKTHPLVKVNLCVIGGSHLLSSIEMNSFYQVLFMLGMEIKHSQCKFIDSQYNRETREVTLNQLLCVR